MSAAPVSYGIGVKNRYAFLDDTTDDGIIKLDHSNNHNIKSTQNNSHLATNYHHNKQQQHHQHQHHQQSDVNNKKQSFLSDQHNNSHHNNHNQQQQQQQNQSVRNHHGSNQQHHQSQKTINSQQQQQHQQLTDNIKGINTNASTHNRNSNRAPNTSKGQQIIGQSPLNDDNTANKKYQQTHNENKSQPGKDNISNHVVPTKTSAPKFRRRQENGALGASEDGHHNQALSNGTITDDEKRRRQQKRANDFKYRDTEKRDARRQQNPRPNQGDQTAAMTQETKTNNEEKNEFEPRQTKNRENNRLKERDWSPKHERPARGGRGRAPFAGQGRRDDGERKESALDAPANASRGPSDGRPPMRRGGGRGGFGGRGGRGARTNGEDRRPREDDRRHQKQIPNFKDNLMFPSLAP